MHSNIILLVPIFFIVALLYSLAGFGGGSSYVAILVLSGVDFQVIRFTALIFYIIDSYLIS